MVTVEELDVLVKEEFKNDQYTLKVWEKNKCCLGIHPEPEYADADRIIWVDVNGSMQLCDEDALADFLWKCGCSLWYTQDWIDGSITYSVALPETEKEYQKNISEGEKFWKENYEEEI